VQRDPDGFHLLAVNVERLQTAGHHRHRANKAALAAHRHPIAVGNAFRLRQPSLISTNCSGWAMALSRACLVQVWKCSVRR
jgi:hypothetical protein